MVLFRKAVALFSPRSEIVDHVDSRQPVTGCHKGNPRPFSPLNMSQHLRSTSTSSLPHRTSVSSSAPSTSSSNATAAAATAAESPATSAERAQVQTRADTQSAFAATVAQSRSQVLPTHEIVRRIVSPGSVLFQSQPPPACTRERKQQPPQPANMDRRHPSSFQQLEKLGEGTYATVSRAQRNHSKQHATEVPRMTLSVARLLTFSSRYTRDATDRPENWSP